MSSVETIRLGDNTVYLWEGGGSRILIDTGPDFEGSWERLQEALGGRRPDLVVATHGHLDHAGLGRRWQTREVPVALGRADRRLVHQPPLAEEREFRAFVDYVEQTGAPPEVRKEALEALAAARARSARQAAPGYRRPFRGGRYPTLLRLEPFEPVRCIEGEETLPGGLEIISVPGHTRGNLVLWDPDEGWLFSGDQLLEDMTPIPAIQWIPEEERETPVASPPGKAERDPWRFRSLPAFRASLERLASLRPETCFPGHGLPFGDVAAVIQRTLRQIEDRTARVRRAWARAGSLYELCEHLYPRAARRRFWQIVATVQGHLDLLECEETSS